MRRKDAELDRHRMWVEHAAIIALATALRPIFCVHPQTEKFRLVVSDFDCRRAKSSG
jgi:hypothetical protein